MRNPAILFWLGLSLGITSTASAMTSQEYYDAGSSSY